MHVPDEIAGEPTPDHGLGEDLDKVIRRLVESQPYGVLCTQGQEQPYGALVAYAMTPALDAAVFATPKATWKYRLLSECARVALVVDTRSALPGQLMDVEAVTVTGQAHEVARGSEFERLSRLLTERHPYLDAFVCSESSGLFRIDIVLFVYVTRFQDVRQWVPTRPV